MGSRRQTLTKEAVLVTIAIAIQPSTPKLSCFKSAAIHCGHGRGTWIGSMRLASLCSRMKSGTSTGKTQRLLHSCVWHLDYNDLKSRTANYSSHMSSTHVAWIPYNMVTLGHLDFLHGGSELQA